MIVQGNRKDSCFVGQIATDHQNDAEFSYCVCKWKADGDDETSSAQRHDKIEKTVCRASAQGCGSFNQVMAQTAECQLQWLNRICLYQEKEQDIEQNP